jgi:hypothetical protein
VAEFPSYYWALDGLRTPDASAARTLSERRELKQVVAAFEHLLASEDVAARGVALDQYAHCEARGRFGSSNPFARFTERVVAEARAQLRQPPVTATTPLGTLVVGANHASALGLLSHLGDATDLESIAGCLTPSQDVNVLEAACLAADHCVRDVVAEAARNIGARLAAIVQDPGSRDEVRLMALAPFRNQPSLDHVEMLLDTARHGTLPLAIHAAWALAGRIEDDTELRRIAAGWPEDAPYPASEVRDLLASS